MNKNRRRDGSYLGCGDLLHVQSVVQQLGGGEVLLHKVLQDLDSHVWVVDLRKQKSPVCSSTTT